jgi:hypothetical protein
LNTVQNIKELAIEIQEAVEEWFDFAREHYK